jgi:hypothetical protein
MKAESGLLGQRCYEESALRVSRQDHENITITSQKADGSVGTLIKGVSGLFFKTPLFHVKVAERRGVLGFKHALVLCSGS